MGSLRDVLMAALPSIIGAGVGVIGSKLVDTLAPPRSSNQLFQEYYRAVENSDLPRTVNDAENIVYGRPITPPYAHSIGQATSPSPPPSPPQYNAQGKSDMATMTDNIDSAITSLRDAKTHTRCSLCRTTLSELEKEVEEKTEFIRQSTKLWDTMQDMKEKGVLPVDAKWSDMTDEQKAQVKSYAN